MIAYNIYLDNKYQYTTATKSLEEAEFEAICLEHPDIVDYAKDYCDRHVLEYNDLDSEDFQTIAYDYLIDYDLENLSFRVIETTEDDIDNDDLILGYIFDGSPSQVISE